jgi:hypothetical protein
MKTDAERQAAARERKRARGLVSMQVWTYPEYKQFVARFAEKMNKTREDRKK